MSRNSRDVDADGGRPAVLDYARPDTMPTLRSALQWSIIPVLLLMCAGLIIVSILARFRAGGRLGALGVLIFGLLTPGNCAAAIAEYMRHPKPWYVRLCLLFNILATLAALVLLALATH